MVLNNIIIYKFVNTNRTTGVKIKYTGLCKLIYTGSISSPYTNMSIKN